MAGSDDLESQIESDNHRNRMTFSLAEAFAAARMRAFNGAHANITRLT